MKAMPSRHACGVLRLWAGPLWACRPTCRTDRRVRKPCHPSIPCERATLSSHANATRGHTQSKAKFVFGLASECWAVSHQQNSTGTSPSRTAASGAGPGPGGTLEPRVLPALLAFHPPLTSPRLLFPFPSFYLPSFPSCPHAATPHSCRPLLSRKRASTRSQLQRESTPTPSFSFFSAHSLAPTCCPREGGREKARGTPSFERPARVVSCLG